VGPLFFSLFFLGILSPLNALPYSTDIEDECMGLIACLPPDNHKYGFHLASGPSAFKVVCQNLRRFFSSTIASMVMLTEAQH
jgi:hypothetical protein